MFVYILQLEKGKYYVGSTKTPYKRISEHFKNNGAAWTKKYKPIEIIEVIQDCDIYDEDKYTRKYMDTYGIDNVRGGSYCTMTLNQSTIKHIEKERTHCTNKCFKCGKTGHYANVCDEINECVQQYETYLESEQENPFHDCNFIPSVTFTGIKPGFVFKKGELGVGYYYDTQSQSSTSNSKLSRRSTDEKETQQEINECVKDYEKYIEEEENRQKKIVKYCLKCGNTGHTIFENNCTCIDSDKMCTIRENKNYICNYIESFIRSKNCSHLTCPLCSKKFNKNKFLGYHLRYTCEYASTFIEYMNNTQLMVYN